MSSGRRRIKRTDASRNNTGERFKSGSKNFTIEDWERLDESFQSSISDMSEIETAAFRSRLDAHNTCAEEEREFAFLRNSANAAQKKMYLSARNFILCEWVKNCKVQLTYADVHASLFSNGLAYTKEQVNLSYKAFGFLERHGYINSGKFEVTHPMSKCNKSVIVIGAGLSGLSCAQHLNFLGFNVTVIEARNRVGGRIHTYSKGNYVADLGAQVITGLGGNPFSILARQFDIPYRRINNECRLYNMSGVEIGSAKDQVIEKEFNRLLEAAKYATSYLGFTETIPGRPVSLGQTIELIIMHQEQTLLRKTEKFYQSLVNLQSEIKDRAIEAKKLFDNIEFQKSVLNQYEKKVDRNVIEEFQYKSAIHNRQDLTLKYENVMKELKILQAKFNETEKNVPVDTYLTLEDRNILDWHVANLEFANNTPVNTISVTHWDQDDVFEFPGDHFSVECGLSVIPQTLSQNLKIIYQTAVRSIDYSTASVVVTTENVADKPASNRHQMNKENEDADCDTNEITDMGQTYDADAVVVSVPLGVLKEQPSLITFKPELPEWKVAAIDRLGFGNLMKVVLCFDKRFWDSSTNLFGFINNNSSSRGECFLFNSFWSSSVLVALIAGESNAIMDELDDDTIVERCLQRLRTLYPDTVARLKDKIVTRWRDDIFCRGAYSYVAVGATGDDYDALAKPVSGLRSGKNNLFFAGEHTVRNYPATAHGALLSGLNAAAQVAEQLIGSVNNSYPTPNP